MRRITVYLEDDLYAAVVRHAEARGKKLSHFVTDELAHLVEKSPQLTREQLRALEMRPDR